MSHKLYVCRPARCRLVESTGRCLTAARAMPGQHEMRQLGRGVVPVAFCNEHQGLAGWRRRRP